MEGLREKWLEILILLTTVFCSVGGSYVATVKAMTLTDARSSSNLQRIERMEESWLGKREVESFNMRLQRIEDRQIEILTVLAVLRGSK